MAAIQRLLPVFIEAKGYYLLPAAAAVLVIARFVAAQAGNAVAARRVLAALGVLAALSVPVYFNFFNFHYGGFVNPHEFFHYYLGSKYAREIGYFDMYNAALVADDETGMAFRPVDGHIWDLRTYTYRRVGDVLADRDAIKARFTPERWREWVADVSYFKRRLSRQDWSEILRDMGYNGTPVYTMLAGGALSGRIRTDQPAGLFFLASLDLVLLAAAVVCVSWAFNAWPALLMVVFVSSSYLMAHVHMRGALLRTDFVVALVAATCLLRKSRPACAGALLGYAAMIRIFPILFAFGPAAKLLASLAPVVRGEAAKLGAARSSAIVAAHIALGAGISWAGWRIAGAGMRETLAAAAGGEGAALAGVTIVVTAILFVSSVTLVATSRSWIDPRHARFFAGCAGTMLALGLASVAYSGGLADWDGFARKIALHRKTYNQWNVGLTSVVIARFDPPGPREEALAARPPLLRTWLGNAWFEEGDLSRRAVPIRLLQAALILAAFIAALRLDDAGAFALGFVPTFALAAPTYYYYIVLLLPFLYFATHPDRLRGTLGLIYLFLFAALGFAFYFRWDQYFTTYYWNSVLALGLSIAMIAAAFGRATPWREGTARSPH